MRRLISLIVFLNIFNLCQAQSIKFKDVGEKHWAESAIYDLVKRGVTSGFPDGTFQGMRSMTRYEMAIFLSKLAENSTNLSISDKLLSELKTEFQAAKYQIENPESFKITGSFEERFRAGNLLENKDGPHGPRIDYRLKLSAVRNFSPTTSLKLNLDTVDAGFNGGIRDLATKLIDVEGKTRLGSFDLKAAAGPGTISHLETDGTIPSDDYYIYQRPKTHASISKSFNNIDLLFSYVTRKVKSLGEVGLSEIHGTAAYTYQALPIFGKTRISLTPRYLWSNGTYDKRGEIQLALAPLPALSFEFLLGIGHAQSSHGLYAKSVLNYNASDTSFSLKAHKVGSEYRQPMDKYEFVYLNNFNKLILDGSVDLGLELSRKISDKLKFKLISDLVLASDLKYGADQPGTSLTNEIVLSGGSINVFYRNYFVPSGLSSTDPTMARPVAKSSDLIGIALELKI